MAIGAIFVSHSVAEKEDITALCAALRKTFHNEIRTFNTSSKTAIQAGSLWRTRILEAIEGSSIVLLWATKNALSSREVAFEIGAAFAYKKPIIPCAVHISPPDLPWSLSELQAVTLDTEDGWRQLSNAIANMVEYPHIIMDEYMIDLSKKFTVSNDALVVESVGQIIKLKNSSISRIISLSAEIVAGMPPVWLKAVQDLCIEPGQEKIFMRNPTKEKESVSIKFTWLDVSGAAHACVTTIYPLAS